MSTCGSGTRAEDYNLSLHVGALFIILAVSAGACALPIVALRVPQLRIPAKAHFGFRHFGTGVLIATAFVHLIPTAFISLIDPCLPPFFNEDYPALAGAIALAAVFMITIAEMIFSPGRSLCSGPGHDDLSEPAQMDRDGAANVAHGTTEATRRHSLANDEITPGEPANYKSNIVLGVDSMPAESTPQFGRSRSGRSHSVMKTVGRRSSLMFNENTFQLTGENKRERSVDDVEDRRPSEDSMTLAEEKEAAQQRHKLLMQCVLLECGILFHSIFIGLALAVAVGSEQVILLIAIAFHQTFEGLALGSRIAAVGWKPRALQPWFMALAYGCTTPLGQAIGIATRNLYDPDSATGLVVVGTFNAFSAGLLTYTSLVDLLSEDFLSDHSWRTLRGRRRVGAMCLVGFGAFCMSLIGAWA